MQKNVLQDIGPEIEIVLSDWRKSALNLLYKVCLVVGPIGLLIMFLTDALKNPEQRPVFFAYSSI